MAHIWQAAIVNSYRAVDFSAVGSFFRVVVVHARGVEVIQ